MSKLSDLLDRLSRIPYQVRKFVLVFGNVRTTSPKRATANGEGNEKKKNTSQLK